MNRRQKFGTIIFLSIMIFSIYLFYSPLPQIKHAQLNIVDASYTVTSSIFRVSIMNNGTVQAYDMTVDIRLIGIREIDPIEPGETRVLEWKREILPPISGEIFPIDESLIFTFKYEGHKKEIVSVGPIAIHFYIEEGS